MYYRIRCIREPQELSRLNVRLVTDYVAGSNLGLESLWLDYFHSFCFMCCYVLVFRMRHKTEAPSQSTT